MSEHTAPTVKTKTGTVRIGQRYRDNRDSNIRTLRVDSIKTDDYGCTVHCVVIHQDHGDGRITEPMRETAMTPARLTSRSFVLIEEDAANA